MPEQEKPMPPRQEKVKRLAPGVLLTWSERPDPARDSDAWKNRNAALIQYRAESLDAMIAHVLSPDGACKPPYSQQSRTNDPSEQWDLGAGWDGTIEACRAGWLKGRKAIAAALATLPGDLVISPPQLSDIAGGVLDCAAHVAGAPDCFDIDDDEAPGRARVVRLLVPTAASCSVPAIRFLNRGAAIASVIDGLEASGLQCEVEAICTAEGNAYDQVTIRHVVKRAGDPLNLSDLALSLAHPGVFRRVDFAALESVGDFDPGFRCDFKPARLCHNYGTPANYRCLDIEPAGTIYLPRLQDAADGKVYDKPDTARDEIAKAMRALGFSVTFEPVKSHG